MKSRLLLSIAVTLLLTLRLPDTTRAQSASTDPTPPSGVATERWTRLLKQLRENSFTEEETRACGSLVGEAAGEGMPVEPLLLRLEEGAAKRAPARTLIQALTERCDRLRTSVRLLRQAGYQRGDPAEQALAKAVLMALESGLSERALEDVLARGGGGRPEQMRGIVEAGEDLRLNGLDEETVAQLMLDFTERNLRRSEMVRACRFAVQEHRHQMDGARIRQRLWGGTVPGWRGGRGSGFSNSDGSGEAAGAGGGAGPRTGPRPGGAFGRETGSATGAGPGPDAPGGVGPGPGGPGGANGHGKRTNGAGG